MLVTLAVDAEAVGLGGGALAATVDKTHHSAVVSLVVQVVELSGEYIEQRGLLPQLPTGGRRPKQLH